MEEPDPSVDVPDVGPGVATSPNADQGGSENPDGTIPDDSGDLDQSDDSTGALLTNPGDDSLRSTVVRYEVTDILPFTHEFTTEILTTDSETTKAAVHLTVTPTEDDAVIHGILLPDGTRVDGTEASFVVEENGSLSFEVIYEINASETEEVAEDAEPSPAPFGFFSSQPVNENEKTKTLTYEVDLLAAEPLFSLEIDKSTSEPWDYLNEDINANGQYLIATLKVQKADAAYGTRTIRVSLDPSLESLYEVGSYGKESNFIKSAVSDGKGVTYTIDNSQLSSTSSNSSSVDIAFIPKGNLNVKMAEKLVAEPGFSQLILRAKETTVGLTTTNDVAVSVSIKKDYPEAFLDLDKISIVRQNKTPLSGYDKGSLTDGSLKLYPRGLSARKIVFSNEKDENGMDVIPAAYTDGYLYIPVVSGYHNPVTNLTITIPLPEGFGSEGSVDLGGGVHGWKLEQNGSSLYINGIQIAASEEVKYEQKASINIVSEDILSGTQDTKEKYIVFAINNHLKADKSYFDFTAGEYKATQPITISYDQLQKSGDHYEMKTVSQNLGTVNIKVPNLSLNEEPLAKISSKSPSDIQSEASTYTVVIGNQATDNEYHQNKVARSYKNGGKLTIELPDTFDPSSLRLADSFAAGTTFRYQLKGSSEWKTISSGGTFQKGTSKVTKIEIDLPATGIQEGRLRMEFGGTTVTAESTLNMTLSGTDYTTSETLSVTWKPQTGIEMDDFTISTQMYFPVFIAEGVEQSASNDIRASLKFKGTGEPTTYKNLEIAFVPDNINEDELNILSLIDTKRITWPGVDTGKEGNVIADGFTIIYTTVFSPEEQMKRIDMSVLNNEMDIDLKLADGDVLTSLKFRMDSVKFKGANQGILELHMQNQSRTAYTANGQEKPIIEGEKYYGHFTLNFDGIETTSMSGKRETASRYSEYVFKNPFKQQTGEASITAFSTINQGSTSPVIKIQLPTWKASYTNSNVGKSLTDDFAEGCNLYLPLNDAFVYVGNDPKITVKTIKGTRYLIYDLSGQKIAHTHYTPFGITVTIPKDSLLCLGAAGTVDLFTGPGYLDYGPQLQVTGEEHPYFTYNRANSWVEDTFGLTEESGVEDTGKRLLVVPQPVQKVTITSASTDNLYLMAGLDGVEGGWSTVSVSPEDHDAMTARVLAITSGGSYTDYKLTIELPREGEGFKVPSTATAGKINDGSLYLRDVTGSVTINGAQNPTISYLDEQQSVISSPTDADIEKIRFVQVTIPAMDRNSNVAVDLKLQMLGDDVYWLADGAELNLSATASYKAGGQDETTYAELRTYQFQWDVISGQVFQEKETVEPDGIYESGDKRLTSFPGVSFRINQG